MYLGISKHHLKYMVITQHTKVPSIDERTKAPSCQLLLIFLLAKNACFAMTWVRSICKHRLKFHLSAFQYLEQLKVLRGLAISIFCLFVLLNVNVTQNVLHQFTKKHNWFDPVFTFLTYCFFQEMMNQVAITKKSIEYMCCIAQHNIIQAEAILCSYVMIKYPNI